MNRIKFIAAISIIAAILVSCSKDDYRLDTSVDPFVRFNFIVNSNNIGIGIYQAVYDENENIIDWIKL